MYYRIKNKELYDYADYKYAVDCRETNIITQKELNRHPNKVLIQNDILILNPDYETEELAKAKQAKYQEANSKANIYLQSGEALFEFEPDKHIEATDGNIAKMTAYALAFVTGQLKEDDTVPWSTYEDVTINLNQELISYILVGLGEVQSNVWTIKYSAYLERIENATTVDEVNNIDIDYNKEIN